jgi:23S rRNA pseudouridine2604 synthase
MATLKLKPKRPGTPAPQRLLRPPIRGMGAGVSKRPTFAGKQSERTQRDERPVSSTERRPSRPGEWPDSRPQQRGDRRDGPAPRPQGERRDPNERPQQRGPQASYGRPNDRQDNRAPQGRSAPRPYEPSNDRPQNRPYQGQDNRPQGRPDDRRNERNDARPNDRQDSRGQQRPARAYEGGHNDRPQARPYQGQGGDRPQNRPFQGPNARSDDRQDPRFNDRARDAQGERPFDRPPIIGTPRPGSATVSPSERQHFIPAQRQHEPRRPIAQRPAPNRGRHHDDDDDDDFNEPAPHAPLSVRLSKRMSELGMASRREADEWIEKGWVRVDDHIVKELGSRVQPDQRITIDARAKFAQAQKVTVIINKPIGYVSGQAEDGYEPAMVLVLPENQWREDHSGTRFLREHLRSLVPAGRLDIDSIGLLVLTQDGRIAKQLIGEDSAIEKEYLVRVAGPNGDGPASRELSEESLALLCHGLELDGEALKPATVEWLNDDQLRFVLQEGKKRQIRRMCEAVGLKVLGLKRVRIGSVMLGDLPVGQWRYLRGDEGFAEPPPAM